ncbi:MazG nucleotide pyrophosphohydrolase domain-containing protein [Solimonas soli]|uniref:MazG nucleotide pyrophosphohydrolase domain-containing protein n=1 Tax=Solimonas soli TaxID=413479 RepID=UPI0004B163C5|nr:MazG nucleotide pyrophosphohydrolase domain-containing protein [Solimonas soli]
MADPLREALRLQREAAALGFDWRHLEELFDKLAEESAELREAAAQGPLRAADELGDLLFMAVNLARHLGVDAPAALAGANDKFARRFAHVRAGLEALPPMGDPRRLEQMEARWQEAKRMEKQGQP